MKCDFVFSLPPPRLHGGLVGARRVSFRVPHRCSTFQRRDTPAGLPEYSQQRWVRIKPQDALKYIVDRYYKYIFTVKVLVNVNSRLLLPTHCQQL